MNVCHPKNKAFPLRYNKWILAGLAGLLSCKSPHKAYLMPYGLRYPTVANEQICINTDTCCNEGVLIGILMKEGAHRVNIRSDQRQITAFYAPMDAERIKQLTTKLNLQCVHLKPVHSRMQ